MVDDLEWITRQDDLEAFLSESFNVHIKKEERTTFQKQSLDMVETARAMNIRRNEDLKRTDWLDTKQKAFSMEMEKKTLRAGGDFPGSRWQEGYTYVFCRTF